MLYSPHPDITFMHLLCSLKHTLILITFLHSASQKYHNMLINLGHHFIKLTIYCNIAFKNHHEIHNFDWFWLVWSSFTIIVAIGCKVTNGEIFYGKEPRFACSCVQLSIQTYTDCPWKMIIGLSASISFEIVN